MREVTKTIKDIVDRLGTIAQKLGIAAGEVWAFSVKAKVVNAKRDYMVGIAEFLWPAALWGVALYLCFGVKWQGDALYALVPSTVLLGIIGLACIWDAIVTMINARAAEQTAENDAFQALVNEFRK